MSRNACNGENGEKSPASGDLNWMSKEAPWRLVILTKLAILVKLAVLAKIARGLVIMAINVPTPWRLAKLAILAKIARGLAISRMWHIFKLDAKSGPFKIDN